LRYIRTTSKTGIIGWNRGSRAPCRRRGLGHNRRRGRIRIGGRGAKGNVGWEEGKEKQTFKGASGVGVAEGGEVRR